MIQQAVTAHQQGKFEEAEKIYQKILETDPTNSIIRNNYIYCRRNHQCDI